MSRTMSWSVSKFRTKKNVSNKKRKTVKYGNRTKQKQKKNNSSSSSSLTIIKVNKYKMGGSGKPGEKDQRDFDQYGREPYDGNFFGKKNEKKRKREEDDDNYLLRLERKNKRKHPSSCGYDPRFLSEDVSTYQDSSEEEDEFILSSSDEEILSSDSDSEYFP